MITPILLLQTKWPTNANSRLIWLSAIWPLIWLTTARPGSIGSVLNQATIQIGRSIAPPNSPAFAQTVFYRIDYFPGRLTCSHVALADSCSFGPPCFHERNNEPLPHFIRDRGVRASPKSSSNNKVAAIRSNGAPCGIRFLHTGLFHIAFAHHRRNPCGLIG